VTVLKGQRAAEDTDRFAPFVRSAPQPSVNRWVYAGAVIVALLLLDFFGGIEYALVVSSLALSCFLVLRVLDRGHRPHAVANRRVDRQDLGAVASFYVASLLLFRLAFSVFANNAAGLFLSFAMGLLLAVGGPIFYTVWIRERRLATLGLSLENLPRTLALAVTFGTVQFALTLWGYDLPAAKDWVPLLGMSLMVGFFEAVFFRGFVQGRFQASFGAAPAVFGAALLYSLYHVGYGMPAEEMLYLFGLGIVYALAYLGAENILVLWPLLTPLGGFFAQLEGGELQGQLPWASLAGFADVLALFAIFIWLARRHERRILSTDQEQRFSLRGASS
jgi:membrane protease YdiL (CAAX protease family)